MNTDTYRIASIDRAFDSFESAYVAAKALARRTHQAVSFTSEKGRSHFTVDDNGNLS